MKRKLLTCLACLVMGGILNAQAPLSAKATKAIKATSQAPKGNKTFALSQTSDLSAKSQAMTRASGEPDEYLTYFDGGSLYTLSLKSALTKPTTVSAAAYFPSAMVQRLKGNKLTSIFVGILDAKAKNVHVWAGTTLTNKNVCDILVESFSTKETMSVNLEEAYELGDQGIFVGVTMDATDISTAAFPVSATPYANSLYIDLGDGSGWADYSGSEDMGSFYIECGTEGSKTFVANDAAIEKTLYSRVGLGGEFEVAGLYTNYGTAPIKSLKVSYTVNGGEKHQEDVTVSKGIARLGQGTFFFKTDAKAPTTEGRYPVKISIDEVNGTNITEQGGNTIDSYVISLSEFSPRTVVFEEGTGTWCGWCPRGMVGMERLKEDYSESAIGIAVHAGDEMQVSSYAPIINSYSGFPKALVNRMYSTDPYLGDNKSDFGLDVYVNGLKQSPCEGIVSELKANYTDESKTEIQINSTVKFNYSFDSTPYKMAYVIVEDGVTGYTQTNYYNKATFVKNFGNDAFNALPEDLKALGDNPYNYKDAVFNDVAVGIYDCEGIEGSFSGSIIKGQEKLHTYTITLPGNIQDKANIRVVALLLEPDGGEIINAKQVAIGPTSGIIADKATSFTADINVANDALNITANEAATAELYNVNGTQLSSTAVNGSVSIPTSGLKGVYIVRVNNGNDVVVKKIVF